MISFVNISPIEVLVFFSQGLVKLKYDVEDAFAPKGKKNYFAYFKEIMKHADEPTDHTIIPTDRWTRDELIGNLLFQLVFASLHEALMMINYLEQTEPKIVYPSLFLCNWKQLSLSLGCYFRALDSEGDKLPA